MTNSNHLHKLNFYKQAYLEAKKAKGISNPNPAVGAVIVKNNIIISKGHTNVFGKEHAEVSAITKAGDKAKNSTLYVTLTPCSFYGKTPPCTELIIRAGIKRVVIANRDINRHVLKNSDLQLRQAGIDVKYSFPENLNKKLFYLNEDFFYKTKTGRPFIVCKYAMTLDGKMATYTGDSKWITNEQSRVLVHKLRLKYDAIMVGENTIITDNATLNARIKNKKRDPLRIILSPTGNIPIKHNIFHTPEPTLFVLNNNCSKKTKDLIKQNKKEFIIFNTINNKFDLKKVLKKISDKYELNSIFVEGGSKIHGNLNQQNIIDKFYIFTAPIILGDGNNALSPFSSNIKKTKMNKALKLINITHKVINNDTLLSGYPSDKTLESIKNIVLGTG